MADLMQQARELLAAEFVKEGYSSGTAEDLALDEVRRPAIRAIAAALRAALEVEVVGEAWRLVDSDGGQFGELYSSEWDASVAQLKWPGDRTGAPFTVQRLELIAARPQGVK